MSYILDALKRADAERERGHVPGLHSQRATMHSATSHKAPPRPSRRAQATAAAVLLLTAAAALWWWLGSDQAAPTARPAVDSAPAAEAPPAPAAAAAPNPPALPVAPVLPILAPPVPAAPTARTPAEAVAPNATAAASPAAATGPAPVRPPTELPPEARAAFPQLSISGATYSTNPEHRMLIVNGQVVREGQTIEPGLVLETISPRTAVFNRNGTRFNVNF